MNKHKIIIRLIVVVLLIAIVVGMTPVRLVFGAQDTTPPNTTAPQTTKQSNGGMLGTESTQSSQSSQSTEGSFGPVYGIFKLFTPLNTPKNVTQKTANDAVKKALAQAKADNASTAKAKFMNPGDIQLPTLKALAYSGAQFGKTLLLQADSMDVTNSEVDVSITLDPSKSTKELNLSASTGNEKAVKTANMFKKYFQNDLKVVSFEQQGSFGQDVQVKVKLDPNLNTENLKFYAYDEVTNTYKLISSPDYWVDDEGYLRFKTDFAGDIIISDGPLTKK